MKKFLTIFLMIAISGGVLLKFFVFNYNKELDKHQQSTTNETKEVDEVELSNEDREISSTIIKKEMSENVEKSDEVKQVETKKNTKIEVNQPKQEEIFYDDGYYKLKNGLFDTEAECWSKGMEVSLTDTVNIAGSYCESVAYKGKIIGYKLYIKYSSGKMEQYLNE